MKMRRGLSLLELMLAMSVTGMVALAITGMLGAVSSGVGSRRDARSVMLLANAAESRLASYIAPAHCVLDIDGSNVVIWLNDTRDSDTVHASEVRWLIFDAGAKTVAVHYVQFPESWTQAARDLEDDELDATSNWKSVLASYQANGWAASRTLIDNVASVTISADGASDMASQHVSFELEFDMEAGPTPVTVAATIRQHETPVK